MIQKLFSLLFFLAISLHAVTITLDKTQYKPTENIQVTLTDMPGNSGDWVGIFPKGAASIWDNVLTWKFDGKVVDGTYQLDGVPEGEYEARVFLDNSYTLLAKSSFIVKAPSYQTNIQTSQTTYQSGYPITVTVSDMPGNSGDWIGIFPKGAASIWDNVLTWKFDGKVVDGTYQLDGVPAGEYEARVFLNNSYTLLSKTSFSVEDAVYTTKVTTSKTVFETGEKITVTVSDMPGNSGDWIGIFPKGAASIWDNVLTWKFDGKVVDGTYNLDSVPVGDYEVRVFLNNSFTVLATTSFSVKKAQLHTSIQTNKTTYKNGEQIVVSLQGMLGNQRDWIGIFKTNAESSFENAYNWAWTDGITDGNITLTGLKAGNYEVRAFFNNTFDAKASYAFTVTKADLADTIYEDAEGGISDQWIQVLGNYAPRHATPGYNNSTGTLVLTPEWRMTNGHYENGAEYHLPMANGVQTILEMDMGGLADYVLPTHDQNHKGYMEHYTVGVYVKTKNGLRVMMWDSWFNHIHAQAHIADYGTDRLWLQYPSPVEHVRGWYEDVHVWTHFKVDLEEALHQLEPDNELLSVEKFMATGGFLDNLKLSSKP